MAFMIALTIGPTGEGFLEICFGVIKLFQSAMWRCANPLPDLAPSTALRAGRSTVRQAHRGRFDLAHRRPREGKYIDLAVLFVTWVERRCGCRGGGFPALGVFLFGVFVGDGGEDDDVVAVFSSSREWRLCVWR